MKMKSHAHGPLTTPSHFEPNESWDCNLGVQEANWHNCWAHTVGEPEQLKQPQIMILPLQAYKVETKHDGCVSSSTTLCPSFRNRVNLDSSGHMILLCFPRAQCLCSAANWSLNQSASLIGGYVKVSLCSATTSSCLCIMEIHLLSLINISVRFTSWSLVKFHQMLKSSLIMIIQTPFFCPYLFQRWMVQHCPSIFWIINGTVLYLILVVSEISCFVCLMQTI